MVFGGLTLIYIQQLRKVEKQLVPTAVMQARMLGLGIDIS